MEKGAAKGVVYALLPILLLRFSSLVGAVDLLFFNGNCTGAAIACNNIPNNMCCRANGPSVAVTSTSGASLVTAFLRMGPGSKGFVGAHSSSYCALPYVGGSYHGAAWFDATGIGIRRRSPESYTYTCGSEMKPNSVVFTEDGTKGHWILPTTNAIELFSRLKKFPDPEKTNWLKSQGAIYKRNFETNMAKKVMATSL